MTRSFDDDENCTSAGVLWSRVGHEGVKLSKRTAFPSSFDASAGHQERFDRAATQDSSSTPTDFAAPSFQCYFLLKHSHEHRPIHRHEIFRFSPQTSALRQSQIDCFRD
jgi:hypothetical protein